jgi:WD40 repeat protein
MLGGFVWHREALDRAETAATQLRQTSLNREQQLAEYRYANDVRLAYQAWQSRDALQVEALLSRQIPRVAQVDRRGFFWWRLWSLIHGRPRVMGPAESAALAVAFSPDGATLCSAGQDGVILFWNTSTGALEAELRGHTADVNCVAFSPDGTWLASAGDDRTLKIWHVAERRLDQTRQSNAAVNSVVFDPSGENLIVGDEQGDISLWRFDTVTHQQQLHGHTQEVNQLAISPDGSRLASAGSDGAIVLWNLQSLSQVAALKEHVGSVTAVAFSPDGQRLASAGVDHMVRLWQVDPPRMLFELRGHTQRIDSVAFTSDGAVVSSAGKDGTLRLWDASGGQIVWTYATEQSRVWSLAASTKSNVVATVGAAGGVRLWRLEEMQRTATTRLPAFAASCDRCDFSLDGKAFTYFDADRQMSILNLVTGERRALAYDSANDVQSVSYSPNGESVWVFDHFGNISAFDLHDGTLQRLSENRGSRLQQKCRVSHNKRCVATSGGRSSRLLTLGNIHQLEREQRSIMLPSFAHDTLFTPDDKTLLLMLDGSAPGQPSMMLIDVATGISGPLPWSQLTSVDTAAFSVDGQYLAYSGGTRQVWVRRWGDPAAEPLSLQASQFISSLAFSPGEPLLAGMGSEGSIFLWSLPDGQPITAFELPTGPYHEIQFSRDGKWLAISFGSDMIPSELLLFAAPRGGDNRGLPRHDP